MSNVIVADAANRYGLTDLSLSGIARLGDILGPSDAPRIMDGGGRVETHFANGFTLVYYAFFSKTAIPTATVSLYMLDSPRGEVVYSVGGIPLQDAASLRDLAPMVTLDKVLTTSGNDILSGSQGNDTFQGGLGNDSITGSGGTDTAVFAGLSSQYAILKTTLGITTNGPDGADHLYSVERLRFSDCTIAYDTAGTAGEAYRLYQAAFDRAPDPGGLGYWVDVLDHGAALNDVANAFVSSAEFSSKYGALSDRPFVDQLYLNVLHRTGEQAGVDYWTGHLAAHDLTRAQVLAFFSESPENQAALIATIQNGMTYTG